MPDDTKQQLVGAGPTPETAGAGLHETNGSNPTAPASPAERSIWLRKLDLQSKVKGELLQLIFDGQVEDALSLLRSGAASQKDVRGRELKTLPTGLTALHLAALYGDEELIDELLQHNADPNVTCYATISSYSVASLFWMDARPLIFAIGAKHVQVVEKLLNAGAPLTINDAWPVCSGEWWQVTGRLDWNAIGAILRLLTQHGLALNKSATKIKWTILHYCVSLEPRTWLGIEEWLRGRFELVDYLLTNGANPLQRDTFGRMPVELLQERSGMVARGDRTEEEMRELVALRVDADDRLKELLRKAMRDRWSKLDQKGGIKGQFQKMSAHLEAGDRVPLLSRLRPNSLRSFSLGMSHASPSRTTDITTH